MLNLKYESEERYTFNNLEQILKVIEIDDLGIKSLVYDNKSITYSINHESCIRLSDLLYWIDRDIVRIHLGQYLDLSLKLLKKIIYLESQGIQHDYLDLNRIWLKFDNPMSSSNLIKKFGSYQIHFTGYQCPFYEMNFVKIQATTQIKNIVKNILERCNLNFQTKNRQNNKQIVDLIDQCKGNSNTQEIIKSILQLQETIKRQSNQSQDIDDDYQIDSKRDKKIEQVNIQLNEIIEYARKDGQLFIENLLHHYISIISSQSSSKLKNQINYKLYEDERNKFFEKQQEQELQFRQKIQDMLKQQIKSTLNEYEKEFKLEITESELNSIEDEIVNSVLQSQQIKYFNNTYWLHKINKYILQFKQQTTTIFILQVAQETIEVFYMLKELELIDNLI